MSNTLSTITTDFIDREGLGFLARIVNEGNTIELATLQTGVRHKATVNSVYADGNFQYGTCAGTVDTATTSSFLAREILACKTTMYDGICLQDVQEKFGALGGEGAYAQNAEVLRPLVEGALSTFQCQVEKNLWNKAGATLCEANTGLFRVISGSTTGVTFSGSASPNAWVGDAVATPTSNNIIAQVNAVYQNIPEIASNKGDLAIFMSVANFKLYVNALSTSTGTVLGGYNVKQIANTYSPVGALTLFPSASTMKISFPADNSSNSKVNCPSNVLAVANSIAVSVATVGSTRPKCCFTNSFKFNMRLKYFNITETYIYLRPLIILFATTIFKFI